jgi:hypothetical protein
LSFGGGGTVVIVKPEECFDYMALPRRFGNAIARAPISRAPDSRARLAEFVDYSDVGVLDPPQPMAQMIGGPYDGEWRENDRDYVALPDLAPTEYVPLPPNASIDDIPPVVMHRWDYLREHPRPCPDSCTVAVFRLSA